MHIAAFLCALILSASFSFAALKQRGLAARPKAPTGEVVKGEQWPGQKGIKALAEKYGDVFVRSI